MAKVLIVEDDLALSKVLSNWLKAANHSVELVSNGLTASEHLEAGEYDLIILDWQLPGQSGIEVCRKYREAGGSSFIIMLTGQKTVEQKEEGLNTGADDYLTKPFAIKELFARIRALLRRSPLFSGGVFIAGDLSLDTDKQLLTMEGLPVKLMPIELSVLEFLMRHPNQVVSCQSLLEKLYAADADVTSNSIYICMSRLRNKVRSKSGHRYIETLHRVGYKFVPH